MNAIRLKTEYLKNPIGIDEPLKEQEFSAAAKCARGGYQHLVATKKHSLDTDRQAKLVRPQYMKLLNKPQTAYARKRLVPLPLFAPSAVLCFAL